MERLERIDISDGLRLLIPPEIAQRDVFGCEVSYQEAILFDRRDGFFHVQMLWWLRATPRNSEAQPPLLVPKGPGRTAMTGVVGKV
jgi:hypothetical protein